MIEHFSHDPLMMVIGVLVALIALVALWFMWWEGIYPLVDKHFGVGGAGTGMVRSVTMSEEHFLYTIALHDGIEVVAHVSRPLTIGAPVWVVYKIGRYSRKYYVVSVN